MGFRWYTNFYTTQHSFEKGGSILLMISSSWRAYSLLNLGVKLKHRNTMAGNCWKFTRSTTRLHPKSLNKGGHVISHLTFAKPEVTLPAHSGRLWARRWHSHGIHAQCKVTTGKRDCPTLSPIQIRAFHAGLLGIREKTLFSPPCF